MEIFKSFFSKILQNIPRKVTKLENAFCKNDQDREVKE